MMKYCDNCTYYKVERDFNPFSRERPLCTYVIDNTYTITFQKFKPIPVYPIPAIHNADNKCPYYKEKLLYKLLRRFKNGNND